MPTISARAVEAAKPKTKKYKLTTDVGLYLCVYPTGLKRWVVKFVINKKQYETTLLSPYGTSGEGYMSLAQACVENERIQMLAKNGVDFRDKDKELRRQAEAVKIQKESLNRSFSELFEVWLLNGVSRQDNNAELRRSFDKDVLPTLGKKLVKDITEDDLRSVLIKMIKTRSVGRMAVRVYNDLMQLFSWAEERKPWRSLMPDGNPALLIDIQQIVGADYDLRNERERILSSDEIRELSDIFVRIEEDYINAPVGKKYSVTKPMKKESQIALWLCLSTLCRIGELLMSEWKHIDFEKKEWFIPRVNIKGKVGKKQDHLIFLSDFALKQFQTLHALTGHSKWCFPSKDCSNHLYETTVSKQVGDRQIRFKNRDPNKMVFQVNNDTLVLAGGENGEWTPHDLRRTGATMMQALKVSLDVIDRCQNHVLRGNRIRRHYLHYDYAEEKKEAWDKLGKRLEEILEG